MSMSTISAPVWEIKDGQVLRTLHKDLPYHYVAVNEEGIITADPSTAQQLLYAQSKATITVEQAIEVLMEETMEFATFGEDGDYDTPF